MELPPEQQTPLPQTMSDVLLAFSEKLKTFPTPEEGIAFGLEFMRQSISQEGSPHFREFWEARRLVLPFFRENINVAIRSKLWGEYVELTTEARRLKDILEEQSSFAAEQIDLAIQALEKELTHFDVTLKEMKEIHFPEASPTILDRRELYNQIQRELNLLNTLASRLNGLRKEIIKTDMRIRFKTRFLKRLSQLGDHIFPKRKELIEKVSAEFEKDVERFVAHHFQENGVVGAPYFAVREEIKALQGVAKVVTLSSGAFSRTRLKLSECWDKVRHLEKEYKKEAMQKKQEVSEQRQIVEVKLEELRSRAAGLTLAALDQELQQIQKEMKELSLFREDIYALRYEMDKLREPHLVLQEQKSRELEAIEKEKLRLKREKGALLKEKILQLQKEGGELELDPLVLRYEELVLELAQWEGSKIEKQPLDRLMRNLRDLVADRKEHSLLNLSEDDRKALENLRLVLEQKKERRREIKEQLEACRKALAASSLDFEKAITYRELMDQEKERLEKANASIEEIEQKIQELEG